MIQLLKSDKLEYNINNCVYLWSSIDIENS